jgi:hypothetical protein
VLFLLFLMGINVTSGENVTFLDLFFLYLLFLDIFFLKFI